MEKEYQTEQKSPNLDTAPTATHSQKLKTAVPRFGSFKPRQRARPSASERSAPSQEWRPKHTEKPATSVVHNAPVNEEPIADNAHSQRGPREQNSQERRTRKPREKVSDDAEDTRLFREDRNSDEYNIRYGTMHRYGVTKYREAGRYRVLGLPRIYRTTTESEPGRRRVTNEGADLNQRSRERPLSTTSSRRPALSRVVTLPGNKLQADASYDYLPLLPGRSRKRRKLDSLHPPPDELTQDSRHADGSHPESLVESDSGSDSGSAVEPDVGSPLINKLREKQLHVSRQVKQYPANVDAWLDLIHHEDAMLAAEIGEPDRALTKAQQHGLADVKLSMYEEALSRTKGQPTQEQLVHGMMTEGARVWDTKKLAKQWKSILREYPDHLGLWTRYLDFEQTNFVTFNYDSFQAIFKDCLALIGTKAVSPDTELAHIYHFLRLTTFMNEAGFSEYAHALWQAIMEFNFFAPDNDQSGNDLPSFESFWDSEVPRLGEDGAFGWKMAQHVQMEPHIEPRTELTSDLAPNQSPLEDWSRCERQRMATSLLSGKTHDEVEGDDPYRMVLFSDIQPFLFRPSSAEAQRQLLEAFLCFCNLPPLRSAELNTNFFRGDQFLHNAFLNPIHTHLGPWLNPEIRLPFSFPMSCFIVDTATLFAGSESWFSPWRGIQSMPVTTHRGDWVQRSLEQLHAAFADDEVFGEFLIAYQSQIDGKKGRRLAKDLLKKQPSIRLYNAFALLEEQAGDMHGSERVWSTALSMRTSFPVAMQRDSILIWLSWMWALLDRQDLSKALRLILSIPYEQVVWDDLAQPGTRYLDEHPTSKLRAHQHLTASVAQCLSLKDAYWAIHHLVALSLLTYLTSNQDLAASLVHYETISMHPTIAQSQTFVCLLHQSRARLLHVHAKTSPFGFRPSDITDPLAQSISLFPSNTIFLSLYHFYTRRSLFIDRIRDIVPTDASGHQSYDDKRDSACKAQSIFPPLFQIWVELNRPSFAGSTSHSIRATFEDHLSPDEGLATHPSNGSCSINPSPVGHSPTMWKLYILWEIHVASHQSSTQQSGINPPTVITHLATERASPMTRALQVLHRAIRACPWAKEIYMLAFEQPELQKILTPSDLKAVQQMMVDKDLRLHVEPDAYGKTAS